MHPLQTSELYARRSRDREGVAMLFQTDIMMTR